MRDRPSPKRERARRRDAGVCKATERDLRLLRIVGEQYALTLPQLAVSMGRSVHAARWLRDRWRRAGWADSRVVLAGRPAFVWLTGAGVRAGGLSYPRWAPTPGALVHVEAVTDVRLKIAAASPHLRWIGERDIRTVGDEHRPDGIVAGDHGDVAVEVELTRKSRARAREIVCELVARYPAVVYFAAPQTLRLIEEVAGEVGQGRVQIRPLPEVTAARAGR